MTANSRPRTAFITGGSSGIGHALATRLLKLNYSIFIADLSLTGAKALASTYNTPSSLRVHYAGTDVTSWSSQLASFKQALQVLGGRIDAVFPVAGIGERKWLPFPDETPPEGGFAEPNLQTLDVDLTGLLYTVSLAVQQFRRQEKDDGWRGKLVLTASICGIVPVPALPIYSAAKYGVVGLTRTYGNLLVQEGITVNAVCPGIARTAINSEAFYKSIESEGILVSVESVVDAFVAVLEGNGSAELFVCRPEGWVKWEDKEGDAWLEKSIEVLDEGHRWIHCSDGANKYY